MMCGGECFPPQNTIRVFNVIKLCRSGYWRGNPAWPVLVIDTPGLGCEEENSDGNIAREILKLLGTNNAIGAHINAFIIVLKSGQSRCELGL